MAVCDTSPEARRSVSKDYRLPHVYDSAAEMASGRIGLDAVSIVSDEATHLETALPFIEAGVACLVEKPLASSLEQASQLVDRAASAGTILMPGHLLRFDPRLSLLHARARAGAFGAIRSMRARRFSVRSRFEKYNRTHPAVGMAIHDLDLFRWFMGSEPCSVHAWSQASEARSAPDLLWTVLEFENRQLAVSEAGWVLPDRAGLWLESELEIIGTRGVATVRTPSDGILYLEDGVEQPDASVLAPGDAGPTGALANELAYFAECVARGRQPDRVTPQDGLAALRLALAVVEADAGRTPSRCPDGGGSPMSRFRPVGSACVGSGELVPFGRHGCAGAEAG